MKITNVVEIFDNDEFVTVVTRTGTSIHLPMKMKHSITIEIPDGKGERPDFVIVTVDFDQG